MPYGKFALALLQRSLVSLRRLSASIESDDVANYCFPKQWPADRERRVAVIGDWLQNRSSLSRVVTEPRRFPPPWSAEETEACFTVRDANGQALAYVYFEEEPARRAEAKLPTRDEARRIAANIAAAGSCRRR